jgi:hypothetical protein
MLIFHPDIHGDIRFLKRNEDLRQKSIEGKIILMTESLVYNNERNGVIGLEDVDPFHYCNLCTAYQTSLVTYSILKEGGKHSKICFSLFLCAVFSNPLLKQIAEQYITENWYPDYQHFVEDFHEKATMENVVQHIKIKGTGRGLPGNIPFSFIRDTCEEFLRKTFADPIEDVIIKKTLLEREHTMYHNLQHFLQEQDSKKEIHILIGAGHLMPHLSSEQLTILNVDSFFIDYHTDISKKYPNQRLLDYLIGESVQIVI